MRKWHSSPTWMARLAPAGLGLLVFGAGSQPPAAEAQADPPGPGVTVIGTVRLAGGATWPANLYVDGERWGWTGEDGAFALLGVMPGARVVSARAPGHLHSATQVLALEAGQVVNIGPTALVPGDVDASGTIDVFDLVRAGRAVVSCEGEERFLASADLNGDGCVTAADLTLIADGFRRVGPTVWDGSSAPSPPAGE